MTEDEFKAERATYMATRRTADDAEVRIIAARIAAENAELLRRLA